MSMDLRQIAQNKTFMTIGGLVVVAALGYGIYYSYATYKKLRATGAELASRIATDDAAIKELQLRVQDAQELNQQLGDAFNNTQQKNKILEARLGQNTQQIDTLTKLTTLDPELLKKYSKVYFLSENYVPAKLASIDTKYLIDPSRHLQILDQVRPHLEDLLASANRDDTNLRVLSTYRSFTEQQQLKSGYLVQYGTGANTFSAEQGYSEHQLGTAVDFTTPTIKGAYTSFENTTAFTWLRNNAHKYGFILSYPKGNRYYVYEPWHWRFVGVELADYLHDKDMYFYEMDQREIDSYLIKIFD